MYDMTYLRGRRACRQSDRDSCLSQLGRIFHHKSYDQDRVYSIAYVVKRKSEVSSQAKRVFVRSDGQVRLGSKDRGPGVRGPESGAGPCSRRAKRIIW